jgi:hypothetical protein
MALLNMHVRFISEGKADRFLISTLEKEMTLFFANMNSTLIPIIVSIYLFQDNDKSVVFLNDSIFFALFANAEHVDL